MKLPSGREFCASAGIVGLRVFADKDYPVQLFEGYDCSLTTCAGEDMESTPERWSEPNGAGDDISDEDRAALAAFMVERWQQWGRLP